MRDWDTINKMTLVDLRSTVKELFRAANYRIARLGEHRMESAAYQKLLSFMGAPYLTDKGDFNYRFKMPDIADSEQLSNQLRQSIGVAERFMESETSTVHGIQKVAANRRKWVRKTFGGFASNKDADEFLRFLGSDVIKEQMQIFDSNIVVEALSNANEHRGEKTLLEMFQDFKASGRSYGSWIIELEDRNKSSTKGSRGIRF